MRYVWMITAGTSLVLLATAISLILRFGGFWAWALFVLAFIGYLAIYSKPLYLWLDRKFDPDAYDPKTGQRYA